ncbi:hypothetical protein [Methylomarinovum tepidoasis]|uniref:hypothetical protein n=1 Tax=Methylomarinovum tepidoasis TaxID=2840183 RepID=UPI0025747E91|nr:hypothetical protein [Methylomarinovum sp. IN45]
MNQKTHRHHQVVIIGGGTARWRTSLNVRVKNLLEKPDCWRYDETFHLSEEIRRTP